MQSIIIHMFNEDFTLDLNNHVDLLGYAYYCAHEARCEAYDKAIATEKRFGYNTPEYHKAWKEYSKAWHIEEQANNNFMNA